MHTTSRARATRWLAFIALVTITSPQLVAETRDWPQWRGPDQTLSSLGNGVFDGPEFGLKLDWKRELGSGYSSISVVGNRAVTMYSDGESDLLVALDTATGEELWRYVIASTYEGHSGSDDGPLGTPTIYDGKVYALGPKGELIAVRLDDGGEIWRQQIEERFEAVAPHYGYTTVPVVVDGHLVVQTGGPGGRSISALDPRTGEKRWATGDDPVGYHSPLIATLGGQRQIVAVNTRHLAGLDPATGEELWRHEIAGDENLGVQPVVVDEGVLLAFDAEAALYRVAAQDGSYEISEAWRSSTIKNSDAVPIYYEGHLYGYSGRFLTCVDAATGEAVWKSRPPGYGGLSLVDGHLVHLVNRGDLVVSEASPAGYREKARLAVSDSNSLSPPSFAGGRIFVRNLTDIAALSITDTAAPAPSLADTVELRGAFGEFIQRLEKAGDKAAVLDAYLAEQESFPIVEGDSLVHFVYRGDVEDIALSGNFLEMGSQESLHHVAGTDLYFRSYEVTPGAHFEYRFHVFDESMTDPLNERTQGPEGNQASVLAMPGWVEPAHLREPVGERGRLEPFTWKSEILENEREMQVYLPPGYDDSDARYPLVIVNYGARALAEGRMANSLDNLIGKSVRPVIVAFLPRVDFNEYSAKIQDFGAAVKGELLPYLDANFRTLPGAENRAMTGIASGAFGSTYLALETGAIGRVATQSFYFREAGDQVREMIAAEDRTPIRFFVEWSVNDLQSPGDSGIQCERDSRELVELLEAHGFEVTTSEVIDGAGWASWGAGTSRILETFFPLEG